MRKLIIFIIFFQLLFFSLLFANGSSEESSDNGFPDNIDIFSEPRIGKTDRLPDLEKVKLGVLNLYEEQGVEFSIINITGKKFYNRFMAETAAGANSDIYFLSEEMLLAIYNDLEKFGLVDGLTVVNPNEKGPLRYAYPLTDQEDARFFALFFDNYGDSRVGHDFIAKYESYFPDHNPAELALDIKPAETEKEPEPANISQAGTQTQTVPVQQADPEPQKTPARETTNMSSSEPAVPEEVSSIIPESYNTATGSLESSPQAGRNSGSFISPDTILTVLDMTPGEGFSESEALMITDLISGSVHKQTSCTIIDRRQRIMLLEEVKFSLSGCTDESCQLEAGKLLSADTIIVGSLGSFGKAYVINLKLLEVETGKTLGSSNKIMTEKEEALTAVGEIVGDLLGI